MAVLGVREGRPLHFFDRRKNYRILDIAGGRFAVRLFNTDINSIYLG